MGERLRCAIDGRAIEADAVKIAPGIYSILIDGESLGSSRGARQRLALRLTVADREWRAEIRDPREWRRNRGGAAEAEGRQQVSRQCRGKSFECWWRAAIGGRGQGIVVVEAMKMQNEVRSPKSGKVERLLVTEGQTVNAGEALAIIV